MRVWGISAERQSLLPPARLCVLSLQGHNTFHAVQLLENYIPRFCWNEHRVWTAVFTGANTSSKYWPVKCSGESQRLRRSAALLQFLLPYVCLNKSTVLWLSASSQVYEAKQGWICCLQTRSYIIYLLNSAGWCVVSGHEAAARSPGRGMPLIDLLQGGLPLAVWRKAVLSQEACLHLGVLISECKREAISPILQWRAPGEASALVRLAGKVFHQTTDRKWQNSETWHGFWIMLELTSCCWGLDGDKL